MVHPEALGYPNSRRLEIQALRKKPRLQGHTQRVKGDEVKTELAIIDGKTSR
jgi:hypothetical protein